MKITSGIYEQLINKKIKEQMSDLDDEFIFSVDDIDEEESPNIISKYLSAVIERAFINISDQNHRDDNVIEDHIDLANRIIKVLTDTIQDKDMVADLEDFLVDASAEELTSVLSKMNNVYSIDSKKSLPRPETSIATSTLFTNAENEPGFDAELNKEIASADRIDLLVSFIKYSGLVRIIDSLKKFTERGGQLRVITTSYMGATDIKAIEKLEALTNTTIKLSYDTKRTRLHAKSYIFYRDSGFTTAYVGSSNLSNPAISSGLEWNIKVTAQDQKNILEQIEATFESYWNSKEFELYDPEQRNRLAEALSREKTSKNDNKFYFDFAIEPYTYQEEILEKLKAERDVHKRYRNLVVAATGTGKTVIAAFDYKRLVEQNPKGSHKLLFVAHREEILNQSIDCFKGVLRNMNFGEKMYGTNLPDSIDHLFASIQSLNSKELYDKTTPDFYDYIIVDEFHHAAAPSYEKLLNYYKPKILLGLTATPERMDGQDILPYFDNRIAAEIRLPEAIDRKLLCPFQYFGVTDTIDLTDIKWSRGGYEKSELSDIYTLDQKKAVNRSNHVMESIDEYVTDINDVKGIGFCVSVQHAMFMADQFNKQGISSVAVTSKSSPEERFSAKDKLSNGDIKFIFAVDIYNEGVDIPEINTVLFLRPTESSTVFIQQLGRGLRLSEGKDCLTVLDFIGQANKNYNFEDKLDAMIENKDRSIEKEIEHGFPNMPTGCFIKLEKKARDYILTNIKASFNKKAIIIERIRTFENDTGLDLTLTNFIKHYHLNPKRLYKMGAFYTLCMSAGVINKFDDPNEILNQKVLVRISDIDSRRFITFIKSIIEKINDVAKNGFDFIKDDEYSKRLLQMLEITLWQKTAIDAGYDNVIEGMQKIFANEYFRSETIDLLNYCYDKIDLIDEPVALSFDCPLDLHCTYSRDQILAAFDNMKPGTVREGVKWFKDKKTDVFFVTLNKSDKEYSPSTMYHDYAINETLFHWESQSTVSDKSPTANRYVSHYQAGETILIFVRNSKKDKFGNTAPYTYLGKAKYVSHTGSRPVSIVWELDKPIPAKYIREISKVGVV